VSVSVARRYAKAIAATAREESSLEETGQELRVLGTLARDPATASVLVNPLLSAERRRALMTSIADDLHLRPTTRNFLNLLADQHRLDQLAAIADHYERLVDAALGRVRARIVSAAEISTDEERALTATLERLTGKKVLAERVVDRELLGGMLVEVEGKVYDGTLRTQLERLAATIAGQHSFF
jgi:F-type H+-transporting ATPase subunit delta